MVEKKEGTEMKCRQCGLTLVCHSKTYPASGNHPEKTVMQWQNDDGTAHYSTKDGKNFTCNIPEGQKPKQENQSTLAESTDDGLRVTPNESLDVKVDKLSSKVNSLTEICTSILHIVTDLKTEGVKVRDE